MYGVQKSSAPQFVEGALVILSLWREPWSYSVLGVEHFARLLLCPSTPKEEVLIVKQSGPNCPKRWSDKVYFLDNLDHFLAKIQSGPNSPTRLF